MPDWACYTGLAAIRRLLEDVENGALVEPSRGGGEERSHRSRSPALFPDDLAKVVWCHSELQHDGTVFFDDVHLDGVRIVDQRARDVRDQVL